MFSDKNKVLIFALFVAHRASTDFSSMLYEYLYNNIDSYIDCPQTCYSVLYFVFNSVLKMKEKLELLNKIEQYVPQYGFEEIYERTFCSAMVTTIQELMIMVNKEATTKKDKDSQPRRYSVQPREDSRTGGSRQG